MSGPAISRPMFRARARHPDKVAIGVPDPRQPGRVQIVVAFDPETFGEIRERAISCNTSFAEQVRLLVEWGLLDAQSEQTQ